MHFYSVLGLLGELLLWAATEDQLLPEMPFQTVRDTESLKGRNCDSGDCSRDVKTLGANDSLGFRDSRAS